MSRLHILLLLATLLFYPRTSLAQSTAGFGASDKVAIQQLLDRYVHAYSAKDYVKLREYLQVPFIRFPATWDVLGTMDELMTYYRNQRDALDKNNYDHSQFVQTRITALAAERALVNQSYRRYRKDGTVLLEAAAIYVVSKSSGTWKICGTLNQDLKDFGKVY